MTVWWWSRVTGESLFEEEMMQCFITQSYPTLCGSTDCSPPGTSIHGNSPSRMREWVAMPSSRGSSQWRDRTQVSHIAGGLFTLWTTREALMEQRPDWSKEPQAICVRDHWAEEKANQSREGEPSSWAARLPALPEQSECGGEKRGGRRTTGRRSLGVLIGKDSGFYPEGRGLWDGEPLNGLEQRSDMIWFEF